LTTRASLDVAGMLRVLDERDYAVSHVVDNQTVFHMLQVATTEDSASHLVFLHDDDKDGNAAYQELITWYDGD